MPDFLFTHPDGRKFNLTAPDAATAVAAFKRQFPNAIPDQAAPAGPDIQLQPGERPLTVFHPPPTVGESAVRGALTGATFNWGDELAGLAAASPIPGKTDQPDVNAVDVLAGAARLGVDKLTGSTEGERLRAAMVDRVRAMNDAAKEENPNAYFMGELGGGVATAALAPEIKAFQMAAPVLQEGAPIANTIARAGAYLPKVGNRAITGATFGTVAGAGGTDGDLADRAYGALSGAEAGAILAPALGAGFDALGAAGRGIANQYRAITNPKAIADRVMQRAVTEDQANLPDIAQQVRTANQGEIPQQLTWADIGGPGIQGLAGQVLRNPGEARAPAQKFVNERQKGIEAFMPGSDSQADRVDQAVGNLLGHEGLRKTTQGLMNQKRANAKPLYDIAHNQNIDYASNSGKELKSILDNNLSEGDLRLANKLLRRDNQGGHQIEWVKNGDQIQMKAMPNVRQWDYIQQGLQDEIDSGTNDITGEMTTSARAANRQKNTIIGLLEDNNPALAAARKQYAGDASMISALKEGGKIWNPSYSRELLAEKLTSMIPAERTMLRIGASNALREMKMGDMGEGANKVRAIFGNQKLAQKARMIAPDENSFNMLKAFMQNEQAMHKTYSLQGGSPTEPRMRQEEATNRAIAVARMGTSLALGHMKTFIGEGFRHLARISPERRSAVMEAIRRVALNPDADAIDAFVSQVNSSAPPNVAKEYLSVVLKALPRTIITDTTQQRRQGQ
jgi:hypothetical protein